MRFFSFKTAISMLGLCGLVLAGPAFCNRTYEQSFYQQDDGEDAEWEEGSLTQYGYYGKLTESNASATDRQSVLCNDDSSSNIETNIKKNASLVKSSLEIDAQLQAELENSDYAFQEPLVILNPYQISPLTAVVLFDTEEPVRVRVTVQGQNPGSDISFETETPECAHRVPVIGLYADFENTVLLELLDDTGEIIDSVTQNVQTESLPSSMDDVVRAEKISGESAFALTMISGQYCKYPFAIDCYGDVRWFMDEKAGNYGAFQMSDGRLMVQESASYSLALGKPQSSSFYEMDYLGRAYQLYHVPAGTHHEIIEKEPGGNLLVLTSSMEEHLEDAIAELDRETGEIVNELNFAEIFGDTYVDALDWAHLNTVSYYPEDDSILVSARNLHSVIKIEWSSHELKWILCDPRFWEDTEFASYVLQPEEDTEFQFEQHSAYLLKDDLDGDPDTVELSLFDNHYQGNRPVEWYDNREHSFAMVFSVNEKENTVTLLKKHPVVFSKFTSNTIYDGDSNHIFAMCADVPEPEFEERDGAIYEMDYETGEVLNLFSVRYLFYRAIELQVNMNDLCRPMKTDENYIKGILRPSVEVEQLSIQPEKALSEDVSFFMIGDVLYVNAYEHAISQLIFQSRMHTYIYDYTVIPQINKKYLQYSGSVLIPLGNLEVGEYELYCMYQDEICSTELTIKIK